MRSTGFFQIILLLAITGCSFSANAQKAVKQLRRLAVGDTLPGFITVQMMDYGEESEQLSAFRGKWLLLDFWATYCRACINAMPHLYALQEDFQDDLNVVMVTREKPDRVRSLLERSPVAKGTEFPFIVEDTLLYKLFPHRIIPHEIWIDPQGVVRAITDHQAVTKENVEGMLSGSVASLPEKRDDVTWSMREPVGGLPVDDSSSLHRSVLKKYNPSIGSVRYLHRDSLTGYCRHIYFSNNIPLKFFYGAFMVFTGNYGSNLNPHRIVIDVKDSLILKQYANANLRPFPFSPRKFPYMKWNSREEFNQDNLYSYDLLLSEGVPDSIFLDYVFSDLNKYFPIKGRVEKRKVMCQVVIAKDKTEAEKLLETRKSKKEYVITSETIGVRNYPIEEFFKLMTSFRSKPIINETGISIPVDILISFKGSPFLDRRQGLVGNMLTFDEARFKQELNKYGLDVVKEEREIPMLVIYDE